MRALATCTADRESKIYSRTSALFRSTKWFSCAISAAVSPISSKVRRSLHASHVRRPHKRALLFAAHVHTPRDIWNHLNIGSKKVVAVGQPASQPVKRTDRLPASQPPSLPACLPACSPASLAANQPTNQPTLAVRAMGSICAGCLPPVATDA